MKIDIAANTDHKQFRQYPPFLIFEVKALQFISKPLYEPYDNSLETRYGNTEIFLIYVEYL